MFYYQRSKLNNSSESAPGRNCCSDSYFIAVLDVVVLLGPIVVVMVGVLVIVVTLVMVVALH